jgi:molecular chaperone GrpE
VTENGTGKHETDGGEEAAERPDAREGDQAVVESPETDEGGRIALESPEHREAGEHDDHADRTDHEEPEEHPHGRGAKSGRKRSKKHRDKELAELLGRKNEMLQDLESRLGESEQLTKKYEDRLLRLAAEFENYKKRTRREWELHEKQANAGLVKGLLHVLDDFNRALEAPADAGEQFRSGIKLINASLTEILARNGLSEIDAKGKPFDPQVHEAVGEVETGDIEPGLVAEVVQRGYMFHDQVLRPARVLISKGTGEGGGSA